MVLIFQRDGVASTRLNTTGADSVKVDMRENPRLRTYRQGDGRGNEINKPRFTPYEVDLLIMLLKSAPVQEVNSERAYFLWQ